MSDEAAELTFGTQFPWLNDLPPAQLLDAGIDDLDRSLAQLDAPEAVGCASSLASLVTVYYPTRPLATLFPYLDHGSPLSVIPLSARASNVLSRHGCATLGDVTQLSPRDIGDIRNTGANTVFAIVRAVAESALRGAAGTPLTGYWTPEEATEGESNGHGESEVRVWGSPSLVALIEDVRELSLVLAALGRANVSPISGFEAVDRSNVVEQLLERVTSHSAADLFPGLASATLLADALSASLATDDEKAMAVTRDRVFADSPATLDEIAQRFGVTRERIRQIETKVKQHASESLESTPFISHVAEMVRARLHHTIPLEELLADVPALVAEVRAVGQPVWRVLDRLDEAYEIADGWVAAPTVAKAVDVFRERVRAVAGKHQLVPVAEVRAMWPDQWITARRSNLRRWLDFCGLATLEGFVMVGRDGMLERAVAVLASDAEPLTAEAIHDRIAIDRSIRSLKNQLAEDDRFVRVGRNAWALEEWGMSGYTSIRDAIRVTIEKAGGAAELGKLVDDVSESFGVRPQSVITYAMAYPFETRDGIVRLAAAPKGASKSPAQSRRVYRRGSDLLHRTTLTHDHMRGSGSLMPSGFAQMLELKEGGTAELPAPSGVQSFYWTGMQPSFGTVKAVAEHRGLVEGEEVFFVITGEGGFDIERCSQGDGSDRDVLLGAIGASPDTEVDDVIARVAVAIGLPGEVSIDAVRRWLNKRGETDLSLLLDSVVGTVGAPS